ncbi:MAG: hypothetical protein HC923_02345 [Myxococcales bacterium]|nr:hypothetical protein [Myxococcales bacterium]
MSALRCVLRGDERGKVAIYDVDPSGRRILAEGFPAKQVEVEVLGFDDSGNVRAYGRSLRAAIEGGASVEVELRRNLAYVIHRPWTSAEASPESIVYVLDVVTRTLVDRLQLPGDRPEARSISVRGGERVLVVTADGARTNLISIFTDDHRMTSSGVARPS